MQERSACVDPGGTSKFSNEKFEGRRGEELQVSSKHASKHTVASALEADIYSLG